MTCVVCPIEIVEKEKESIQTWKRSIAEICSLEGLGHIMKDKSKINQRVKSLSCEDIIKQNKRKWFEGIGCKNMHWNHIVTNNSKNIFIYKICEHIRLYNSYIFNIFQMKILDWVYFSIWKLIWLTSEWISKGAVHNFNFALKCFFSYLPGMWPGGTRPHPLNRFLQKKKLTLSSPLFKVYFLILLFCGIKKLSENMYTTIVICGE